MALRRLPGRALLAVGGKDAQALVKGLLRYAKDAVHARPCYSVRVLGPGRLSRGLRVV